MKERNFGGFYEKYLPLLRKIARDSLTKPDYIDTDDLVQEMCLDLWFRWQRLNLEDKTDSYLVQGCRLYLKNYLRKVKDRSILLSLDEHRSEDGSSLSDMLADGAPDLRYLAEKHDLVSVIRNNGLTKREKEVFELYLEGLNTREIGTNLGISHVRVVKLEARIREKVKQHLK